MLRVFERLKKIQDTEDFCLIHGDTHLGNLYEDADGKPGFFDAQVTRASWSLEVPYHVIGAIDQADRPKWERALLSHYLQHLRHNGVEPPSFDAAWELYMWGAVYGYHIFLINETAFQTESVNTAVAARFAAALLANGIPGQQ
jgi:aminoglycoside phosphotransferase (APT) family kinase protein